MYAVIENDNIIAYHDTKKITKRYAELILIHHDINLEVRKIKKKDLSLLDDKDDLYLVRYKDVYIQTGYLLSLQLIESDFEEDERYAIEILYRILETEKIKKKDYNKIEDTIKILEKLHESNRTFVPTLKELKRIKMDYDPYIYNMGLME